MIEERAGMRSIPVLALPWSLGSPRSPAQACATW